MLKALPLSLLSFVVAINATQIIFNNFVGVDWAWFTWDIVNLLSCVALSSVVLLIAKTTKLKMLGLLCFLNFAWSCVEYGILYFTDVGYDLLLIRIVFAVLVFGILSYVGVFVMVAKYICSLQKFIPFKKRGRNGK